MITQLQNQIDYFRAIASLVSMQTKGRWDAWFKVNNNRMLIESTCTNAIAELQTMQTEAIKTMIPFQTKVSGWMLDCFGREISRDKVERNHRFLEEALELMQACGGTQDEAYQLVRYVFNRPVGEKDQEVGGVMVTLAALCAAQGIDMERAGYRELNRISGPEVMQAIRKKQQQKPKFGALPQL